jgi:hypothetical protein
MGHNAPNFYPAILSSVMRRLLIWKRLSFSIKPLVDSTHDPFEKLDAILKIENRASLVDQSIAKICNGLLLEGYLGFKLYANTLAILTGHTVSTWNH